MSTTTTTGTLTAGSSKTFNLAPGSALSLTLSPNVRVTITETPETVSGSGVGGNTTRVHEPQLAGTFAYGPYAMGGVVVVAVASNSGSSVAWTRKDTVVSTSSDGLSLVSGDGTVISFTGPAYTWAGKPAAANNAGNSIRITDVGPVGAGSVWISDGTNWRPIGGRVMHCAASGTVAAPLATLSGATGKMVLPAGDRVTAGSILMPVGLPQIGQGVEVSLKCRHRGTGGAWNIVGRLGSLDTSSDPSFMQVTGTATDDQSSWLLQGLEVVTATSFVASTFAVPNQAGTGAIVLRNSNFNNAAQLYLGFYSSTLNAADFLDLISYRVYFIG